MPEKGIRYLVEAFKNVKTDKKLVIAGGSSDTDSFMEELKELAKDDDRILFTGFVQGAMLDELYSNAYIYTLPSDLEGMPLSLLEAMSYGNCCLVSDIPECAEVVEDKALIFKKSDVEDLREKLQEACDHPEMVMKMKNKPILVTNYATVGASINNGENGLIVSMNGESVAEGLMQLSENQQLRNQLVENLKKEKTGNEEEINKYIQLIEENLN